MNKKLLIKAAMMVLLLGTAALLQGCGEDDDLAYSFMWAPTSGTSTGGAVIYVSSW